MPRPDQKQRDGAWEEWQHHVLIELERHNEKLDAIVVDVAELKVKAGLWGGISGLFTSMCTMILYAIKH